MSRYHMWIYSIDVCMYDAIGNTSRTHTRQYSTAHWANTLMVNKNKLCARSLAHMNNANDNCSHVSPAFESIFIAHDVNAMLIVVTVWCSVSARVCVTVINIPSASTILHVDFSRTMWHLKDKWLHVGRISFKYIFAVIHGPFAHNSLHSREVGDICAGCRTCANACRLNSDRYDRIAVAIMCSTLNMSSAKKPWHTLSIRTSTGS